MRKVPIIQAKSEKYHKIEKKEAEKILEQVDEKEINILETQKQISEEQYYNNQYNNWLIKTINRIKTLFLKHK